VEDYARQLGYSVRTLTRASHLATGYGAKRVIQERVLLEAKRLLVHTELTSTAIAARIGMPDPTTFGKFFRRQTGETPADFRARVRGLDSGG
jgi:AraC-like DNA-binding protein